MLFAGINLHSNRLSSVSCRLLSAGKNSHKKEHPKVNYYDILRISPKANSSQIKTAYYKLSMIYHPDKNQGSAESKNKFAAVSEAYQVLSDEKKRLAYNKVLFKQSPNKFYFSEEVIKNHKKRNLKYAYDYDEWTRAHYGNAFQESQRRTLERLRQFRIMRTTAYKKLIYQRIIQITFVLVAVFSGLLLNIKT